MQDKEKMLEKQRRSINSEKLLTYVLITAAILTSIIYIGDIKERIRACEKDIEYLKEKTMIKQGNLNE